MKLFNKWDTEIEIKDLGMSRYISTKPLIALHSGGRHSRQQFNKSSLSIVERLINSVMRSEENNGKKMVAYKIVDECFDIIHRKTKENPLQVFVDAITNAGPREEIVRLKYGGIAVPKSVDSAPQRRVDIALRNITAGAEKTAFKSKRSMANVLADEIIAASKYDVKSYSIGRKESTERVAKAAR